MNNITKIILVILLSSVLVIAGCSSPKAAQPASEEEVASPTTPSQDNQPASGEEVASPTTPPQGSQPAGEEEVASPITPPQGTQVGNLAPDFQLLTLDQEVVSLSGLQGKPVMLNFWATWCRPCVYEMPLLQGIYEQYSGEGLVLAAINLAESPSKVDEFMIRYNLSLPVLLDDGVVATEYGIRYIPTTFFIDRDGIIQGKKIGAFRSKAEIEDMLTKIMP